MPTDPEKFDAFQNPLMRKVGATKFYRHEDHAAIRGWMTPRERQTLYALARHLPGPITEIGSWVGLSTTAIARGIKDSGEAKVFRTYDLKLSEANFRPSGDGYGMYIGSEKEPSGTCTLESYENEIKPVITAPGGANAMLKRNLASMGLNAETYVGDFRTFDALKSKLLFCDALHDEKEVISNSEPLKGWLQAGSILACHDVGASKRLIELLRERIPLGHGASIDSLYVAEVI